MKYATLYTLVLIFSFGLFCVTAPAEDGEPNGEGRNARTKSKKASPMKDQVRELEGEQFITHESKPVRMSATYYYGNADKETIPVLLLHDMNGGRADFEPLIKMLTKGGYAVLAVDLRGHGRSTKRLEKEPPTRGNVRSGPTTKLVDYLAEDFQPQDFLMMTKADLPLLRNVLVRVHDEGMINLNRLVVVGIGRGAALAAFETAYQWKDKDSSRLVKTLVLIAPIDLVTTAPTERLFRNNRLLREHVAVLTLVPQDDSTVLETTQKIRKVLLDKEAENDTGGMESPVPLLTYSTEKTVRREDGDKRVPMSTAELFSNTESKLGPVIYQFIERRNQGFKEREYRWSRLR